MIRRVAPAILAVMLLTASAWAEEQVNSRVEIGVAEGKLDNGLFDDRESFVAPSLTMALQSEELVLEFRARGFFAGGDSNTIDEVEVDGHTRYIDVRGLLGWSIPLGSINRLEILTALSYRDMTVKYRDTDTLTVSTNSVKINRQMSHADLGLRHGITLGEQFEIVTEGTCGLMFGGRERYQDDAGDDKSNLESGFFAEVRTTLNWYFAKNVGLQLGLAYEYARFRLEESFDYTNTRLWSAGLGLVFKF
jgi:hypothetical protein